MKTTAHPPLRLLLTGIAAGSVIAVAGATFALAQGQGVSARSEAGPGAPGLILSASVNQVDTRSAGAVRAAYAQRWAPSIASTLSSGGKAAGCATGTTNAGQQSATLTALNFARGLVGENTVSFTAAYNSAAARSAVITSANQALSHDPPSSWTCWTQAGHDASASSNLLLTSSAPSIADLVDLYLADPGSSNTAAGHRRWLLRPEATTMGSGNAQGPSFANSIYVLTQADDNARAAAKPYYAWPSAGYFPSQLEPGGRWSLSSSTGASFAKAKVTVNNPNHHRVAITQRATTNGYGDNTLVWDFATPPAAVTTAAPRTYTVRVSGITGGAKSSYTYYVRLFDPTQAKPADEPASMPVSK